MFGVVIGAGILQLSFNAVNLIGKSLWQNVVAGAVILPAVIVDRLFETARAGGGERSGAGGRAAPTTHGRRERRRIMSTRILVTGAAGKVGQAFIARLLDDPSHPRTVVRALCHNRKLPARAAAGGV